MRWGELQWEGNGTGRGGVESGGVICYRTMPNERVRKIIGQRRVETGRVRKG